MANKKNGSFDSSSTVAERDGAQRKLDRMTPPKQGGEITTMDDQFSFAPVGTIVLHKEGNNAFLRQSSLSWLLGHVKEGQKFSIRTVPMGELFGPGDYYSSLNFFKAHGLVEKTKGGYILRSIEAVRKVWNNFVEKMKI